MCRVLSYLGNPVNLENLFYNPDNSFIEQSYNPKYMSDILNLAGFGLATWGAQAIRTKEPFIYKTTQLPFYDRNLRSIIKNSTPHCFLSHLRGVDHSEKNVISNQNVHPFIFRGTNILLAHNGHIAHFDKIKFDLLKYIKRKFKSQITGTTDSEWIYAVFISQLKNVDQDQTPEEISDAIIETLKIIRDLRKKHSIDITSPANLFISNGHLIAATRFVFDYGWYPLTIKPSAHYAYHSLWYTYGENYGYHDDAYRMKLGKKNSIIIASEPLTEDTTTWIEIPEYSLMVTWREKNNIKIFSRDILI